MQQGPGLTIYTLEEKYPSELISKFMEIILSQDKKEEQALIAKLSAEQQAQFDQYLADLESIRADLSQNLDDVKDGFERIDLNDDTPTRDRILTKYRSELDNMEYPVLDGDDSTQAHAKTVVKPRNEVDGEKSKKKCVIL